MSGGPLMSVVTPAYNEQKYIGYNLESVMKQTYDNIEHVVVNDGSTDDTREVLEEYEGRYNLRAFHQPNRGQAVAINRGFEEANGDLVFWLNADDVIFHRDTISMVVGAFESNRDADILYGNRAVIGPGNELVKVRMNNPFFSKAQLYRSCFAAFNYMRSDVVREHKLDNEYELSLDYEYFLRLASEGLDFHYLNSILYCYRRHANTKTIRRRTEQYDEASRFKMELRERLGIHDGPAQKAGDITADLAEYAMKSYAIKFVLLDLEPEECAFPIEFDSRRSVAIRSILNV